MNQLDRFELIDKIGRQLQSRMTYADINLYLKGFQIDTSKETSNTNSKWVYVKELLADESVKTVLQIAEQLEIDHPYQADQNVALPSSGYWIPNHFRLFLSHLVTFKETTFLLKQGLAEYAISSFVAHESIAPTQEWEEEIEKALFSMDAMAAIVMPGFIKSNWCDQEVGVAIGRKVLVIPVLKDSNPHGFLGKVQGLQTSGKSVNQVARNIFRIIAKNPKTRGRMSEVLVGEIVSSTNPNEAIRLVKLLQEFESIPTEQLQALQSSISASSPIRKDSKAFKAINGVLEANDLLGVSISDEADFDDIPF